MSTWCSHNLEMFYKAGIFVAAFLVVSGYDHEYETCPLGWSLFEGSCYSIGKVGLSFVDAQTECRRQGGYLAEIASVQENTFVQGLVRKAWVNNKSAYISKAYIGASWFYDSQWYWDYTWDELTFEDWANPAWKPKAGAREYCGAICRCENWAWIVANCQASRDITSVCEREPVTKTRYVLLTGSFTAADSQTQCRLRGGYVLEINSKEENDFIIGDFRQYHTETRSVWLGATDVGSEGDFYWFSTNKSLEFTYWRNGEPNNSGREENCAVIEAKFNYKWNDVECQDKHPVVCETSIG